MVILRNFEVKLARSFEAIFESVFEAVFESVLGWIWGINLGAFGRAGKKTSAESFKKESAVCRNEKRSLLQKKAQLFLHNF